MISSARPLFQHVPGAFCDPVGLAGQQAPGTVSLIIAHYPATPHEDNHADAPDHDPNPLGDTYDAFVAVSGQLLAVARTTPDYRFPVMPQAALDRFSAARADGHAPAVSLFSVDEPDCARFLETVFYQECLKLHVDGPDSLDLVAVQLDRAGCAAGILEVNDFSDPASPRLLLVETTPAPSRDALARYLDGAHGRVLLYDRAKNQAAVPQRTDQPFDLSAAIEQATRLALDREAALPEPPLTEVPVPARLDAKPSQDASPSAEVPVPAPILSAPDPHAASLGALVAELQGRTPPPQSPLPTATAPLLPQDECRGEGAQSASAAVISEATRPATEVSTPASDHTAPADMSASALPDALTSPPALPTPLPPTRHPLATELDRLRADAYDLFEDAVGRERAEEHEAHILAEADISSPVPAHQTADYLRALLTGDPPKRWHFFKRARTKTYPAVAGQLLAFHAANGHRDAPDAQAVVHALTQLWTRLHR